MRRRQVSLPFSNAITIAFAITILLQNSIHAADSSAAGDLPPVRTEVKYLEDKEKRNDDPKEAWEEWGETTESKRNQFPRRQREIKPGMDIHTIMGMAMRQPKVVTAVLTEEIGSSQSVGQMVTTKFRNQMNAAGIGCKLWFVPQGRQVIANCETIRDGHMAKEYMVMQPEIMRTVIDNIPFTPKPRPDDDDDDDDDEDDGDDRTVSNTESLGKQKERVEADADTKDEL